MLRESNGRGSNVTEHGTKPIEAMTPDSDSGHQHTIVVPDNVDVVDVDDVHVDVPVVKKRNYFINRFLPKL